MRIRFLVAALSATLCVPATAQTDRAPSAAALADMDRALDQALASDPRLVALRQYDRPTFDAIAAMYREGLHAGKPIGELIGTARAMFTRATTEKLRRAPDALILSGLDTSVAEADELAASAPQRCVALYFGTNAGDIAPFISARQKQRDTENYYAILKVSNALPAQPVLVREQLAAVLQPLAQGALTSQGMTQADLAGGLTKPEAAVAICKAQAAYFRAVRADPRAVLLYRSILVGRAG